MLWGAKNNADLLEKMNTAILSLSSDGTLKTISDKWLSDFVSVLTFDDFLDLNAKSVITILVTLIISMFFVALQRILTHRGNSQKDLATGLFNKKTTERLVEAELAHKHNGAMLLVDIDNFKNVNDKLGHITGDQYILSLANILKSTFRQNDIIGRIGGDEFMVFLKGNHDKEIAIKKAKILYEKIEKFNLENPSECPLHTSVGISLAGGNTDFKTMYEKTDNALYKAKELGKNRVYFDGEQERIV